MDEKLQNLLNTVQKTAVDVGTSATGVALDLGRRASDLLSVGKLNMEVADLRSQVAQELQAVGGMIYATHTGTPSDSDALLSKLQEIDALNARIGEDNARIASLRGPVCPHCGASVRKGDAFCRECGTKL